MPLDNFITRPDFSRQIKQYSSTTANLSGSTKIAEDLFVKNIEIDTENATVGNVLVYNGEKFLPAAYDAYGEVILRGMILSYNSGLTYNISSGEYRMYGATYVYTGGSITINSGNSLYSRFDIVYVTGDTQSLAFVLSGTPSPTPTVPSLVEGQLQVGIIAVGANFTGGTGSTLIQVTSDTVFEYYTTSTGIQRAGAYNAEASGQYSFALSRNTRAYGQDSVALGLGAIASGQSQTVVGQYNSINNDDYFIVGNGTSDGSRANAFRVTTGGSAYVTNKLYVTNYEIETTGASTNFALIYDGSKFKPQSLTTASGAITGLTSAGTGNILILSSLTNSNIVFKTISAGTNIGITESNGTIIISGSGGVTGNFLPISGGTLTGNLLISNASLSANTVSFLNSNNNQYNKIEADGAGYNFWNEGSTKTLFTVEDTNPNVRIGIGDTGTRGYITYTGLSTDRNYYLPNKDGTFAMLSDLTGATGSSGSTSGTSLGSGVKVLFSSDTTSLSFATLSSQTPSTLRIISSSTGVILFSAVTGSGGSGGGISALTSAGTGNIQILSSITNNNLVYKTISAGTGVNISEGVNGTLTFITNNYEYMDYSTASAGGPFTVGQWYRIPISSRTVTQSSNPNNYGDILLVAVDNNKLSPDGYLFAINADYNNSGTYTDANTLAGGTTTQRGVPRYNQNIAQRDIVIFNNTHWLCTTTFPNAKNLSELQGANFTELTKNYTSTYGYIIESDKITYDLSTDKILSRIDKRGNIIHENNANLILDRFRFGDDNVTNNFIKASNVQNFDVLNIPKNNFIFKDNTFTSFNKLYIDTITTGEFATTGTACPINISGVSVNDGKFEVLNRITAYNGSINNYKSTIEDTLTVTSSTIDLTYKYLTGKITLISGSGFNRVISSITQIANVLYNVDVTFNTQNISGITFQNADIMKTEGGISAFISGTTYDNIEFGQPYGQSVFLQKNISNYI